MEPNELPDIWMDAHGSLNDAQQKRFLNRPEVVKLCQRRKPEVINAVGREKSLEAILFLVEKEGWSYAGTLAT